MNRKTTWTTRLEMFVITIIIIEGGCEASDNPSEANELSAYSDVEAFSGAGNGVVNGGATGILSAGVGGSTPGTAGQNDSMNSSGSGESAGASGSIGDVEPVDDAGSALTGTVEEPELVGDEGPAGDAGSNVVTDADSGQNGNTPTGADPCGSDAEEVSASPRTLGNDEPGSIDFETPHDIGFISLKTTLTVPGEASGDTNGGTLFIWPGLMPGSGSGFTRGVLQPVLTWGGSCADPGYIPPNTWWIACMYVPGLGMCEQGDHMDVEFHDTLDIEMTLEGTIWKQVATNRSNGQSVSFSKDLGGASQWWALFAIEPWSQAVKPTEDVVFTDTVMKMARPAPTNSCQPTDMGADDWLSTPRISKDRTTCCISKIILRDLATTPTWP